MTSGDSPDAVGAPPAVESLSSIIALPPSPFGPQDHWYDGKAEVARYRATRRHYGKLREFDLTLIQVKEDFHSERLVKSDDPAAAATIPVMKTHIVYDMPTENYDYHMAASIFTRLEQPAVPVKFVSTSHEYCGITTKLLDLKGERPQFVHHSYFEPEHDARTPLQWPQHGVLEEQLFLLVRTLPLTSGYSQPLRVLTRQLTSRAEQLEWRAMTLQVAGERTVQDAHQTDYPTWHITLTPHDRTDPVMTFDVERDYPHRLIAHTGPDDFTLRLDKMARWAYWNRSNKSPF